MGDILHDVPVMWGETQVGVAEIQGNEILITLSSAAGENISHGVLVGQIHGLNIKPAYSRIQPSLFAPQKPTELRGNLQIHDD